MVVTSGRIRAGRNVFAVVFLYLFSTAVGAATLPEDNVDVLYHRYDGGGMVIDGPSVLVRKSVGTQFSFSGHYYVDSVSAASVDVLATASKYEEERTQVSAGMDYLHEKTIMSIGYTNSDENDFEADTVHFSVSQDFFGDLTNLTMAYARGWDEVGKVKSDFSEDVDRHNYSLGLSQVVTKSMLLGLQYEVITDEGYLNNPYRQYRFINPAAANGRGFEFRPEVYPETRTSHAVALRVMYYLPYRAALKGEYRFYTDDWGIDGHTFDVSYTHPLTEHWILEGRVRYYTQGQADFYSDLFPYEAAQTHLARDKEMSKFHDVTWGAGVSYELGKGVIPMVKRMQFSLLLDYLDIEYDNFRDVTRSGYTVGNEPLYSFDAWITRASFILEY